MIQMENAAPVLSVDEERYLRAVEDLRAAEIEEAESFLVFKFRTSPPASDWTARAQALIEQQGKVGHLKAMVEVYRARLFRGETDASSV